MILKFTPSLYDAQKSKRALQAESKVKLIVSPSKCKLGWVVKPKGIEQ